MTWFQLISLHLSQSLLTFRTDEPGVTLFAFHGKLNKKFRGNEEGDLHQDILEPRDGVWAYENRNAQVFEGMESI